MYGISVLDICDCSFCMLLMYVIQYQVGTRVAVMEPDISKRLEVDPGPGPGVHSSTGYRVCIQVLPVVLVQSYLYDI